jgi:hypothetical protein
MMRLGGDEMANPTKANDKIDQFLDGADIRGTEHRAEARKVIQAMLDRSYLQGKLDGHRIMAKRVEDLISETVGR